jgi:aspartyl-tRNA(Asn)/glutamyl-tRNA(Gln) amidotransferase subunit B
MAAYFESTVAAGAAPKTASDWIQGEILRELKERSMDIKEVVFAPEALAHLIGLVEAGKLNRNTAVKVFRAVFADNGDIDSYVKEHGLEQVNDAGLVEKVVSEILAANPQSVADYQAGKKKASGFLMGQCMKALKGKGDPKVVSQTLEKKLMEL